MPEKYRLLSRKLGDGLFRCLILRIPVDDVGKPSPISGPKQVTDLYSNFEKGEIVEANENQWLYGLAEGDPKVKLALNRVVIEKGKRVAIDTENDVPQYSLQEASLRSSGNSTSIELFSSTDSLWKGTSMVQALKDEVVGRVNAFCCSHNITYFSWTQLEQQLKEGETPKINVGWETLKDRCKEKGVAPTSEESDPVGPASLIQLYLDDRSLKDVASSDVDDDGGLGALALAALSGYVFDAEKISVNKPISINIDVGEAASLEAGLEYEAPEEDEPSVSYMPLSVDQESEGIYLRVDWSAVHSNGGIISTWKEWIEGRNQSNLSDHTFVVKRSLGQAPSFGTDMLARSPLMVKVEQNKTGRAVANVQSQIPDYFFVDRLKPDEFVGKLMHYQIEVRNVVDQTIARGQISIRRQRLDPPPMPADAAATMSFDEGPQKLQIDVELPGNLTAADVTPVVWYHKRPLDACGFFGTDDDMALEEGLRQADLNFEESADTTDSATPIDWEGHPASRYLRGAYDRHGLTELKLNPKDWNVREVVEENNETPKEFRTDASNQDAKVRRIAGCTVEVNKLCELHKHGARLYIAFRRKHDELSSRRGDEYRTIESVLRPCDHFILFEDTTPQRVFQIEAIPREPGHTYKLIDPKNIALHYIGAGDTKLDPDPNKEWNDRNGASKPDPFRVRVQFAPQHSDSEKLGGRILPGGFRVWVRDVVGSEKPPFELASSFEVLPAAVYRFRPYLIDSTKELWGSGALQVSSTGPITKTDVEAGRFFEDLSLEIRKWDGSPRLVRSDIAGDSKSNFVPPTIDVERAKVLLRKLGIQQFLNVADVVDSEILNGLFDPLADPTASAAVERKMKVLSHWALLGPFVDWAYKNGLARDLILPIGIRSKDDLKELVKPLNEFCASRNPKAGEIDLAVIAFAVVPAGWTKQQEPKNVMATVRICLLPRKFTEPSSGYTDILKLAVTHLEKEGLIHIYEEIESNPSLLPFDDSGTCTIEWSGINDLWLHQLECVVEQLDRYAMVNAMLARPKTTEHSNEPAKKQPDVRLAGFQSMHFSTTTENKSEKDYKSTAYIKQLVVPRLMLAPPPPTVHRVPGSKQLAFRIEDAPERKAAAHNLLARVRGGRITRIIRFEYMLPWLERFNEVFSERNGYNKLRHPDTSKYTSFEFKQKEKWSDTDEDIVEIENPLFFAKYRIHVHHRADQIERSESEDDSSPPITRITTIEAQNNPTVTNLVVKNGWTSIPVVLEDGGDNKPGVLLKIPLVQLEDLLTVGNEGERREVSKYNLPEQFLTLPDLATQYNLYYREEGSNVMITLGVINMPGYDLTKKPDGVPIENIKPTLDPGSPSGGSGIEIQNLDFDRDSPLEILEVIVKGLDSKDVSKIEVRVTRDDLSGHIVRS